MNDANMMIERLCHVLRLATELGVFWCIEQPQSSASCMQIITGQADFDTCFPDSAFTAFPATQVLWHYPAMKATIRACKAQRVSFWMCAYGAPSVKPTVLPGCF